MLTPNDNAAIKEINKSAVAATTPAETPAAPVTETPKAEEETPAEVPAVETAPTEAPTTETPAETPNETPAEVPAVEAEKPNLPADVIAKMKESGFDSIEQLLEAAKKKPEPVAELTEEEKTQKANEARVAFDEHAIKVAKLSPEYLRKVEDLESANEADVVFDDFKADWLKTNPDADVDDIQFAFNSQFGIDSDDEVVKAQGAKMLAMYKQNIVAKESADYNKAKLDFSEMQKINKEEPIFKKNVLDAIETSIVNSVEIGTGEEKTNFKSTITRDAVFKHIKKELGDEFIYDMFSRHLDGQTEQVSSAFKTLTAWAQKAMIFDDAAQAHGNKMKSIGLSEGALGSKAPFNAKENVTSVQTKADLTKLNDMYGG